MKRILCLILAMLCTGMVAMCEASDYDWYMEIGEQMTLDLGVLVSDETYLEFYGMSDFECFDALRTADYEQIAEAYFCKMPSLLLLKAVANLSGEGKISDVAWEIFERRYPEMILTIYHGNLGANELAAITSMSFSRTFSAPEFFSAGLLLIEIPNGMTAIAFSKTGEDTVTATIQPVILKDGDTAQTIAEIQSLSMLPMKAEKIR